MRIQGQYYLTSETGPDFPVESFLVEDIGSLDIRFNPGVVRLDIASVTIASGTLAMTDDMTNYVFVNSSGTMASNTTGFPQDSIPIGQVVTSSGTITSVIDERTYLFADNNKVSKSGDTMEGDLDFDVFKAEFTSGYSIEKSGSGLLFTTSGTQAMKLSDGLLDLSGMTVRPDIKSSGLTFSNSSGTTAVVFEDGGNVGIGTLSPSDLLDVAGNVRGDRFIMDRGVQSSYIQKGETGTNKGMSFYTVDNHRMIIEEGGNIGVGTATPDASAKLDVASTSAGFLPPRMTTIQRDAISSPATGLTIYNTTTSQLEVWDGSSWAAIGGGGLVPYASGEDIGIAANTFISISSLPSRTSWILSISIKGLDTGAKTILYRFNADSGNNYTYQHITETGTTGGSTGANVISGGNVEIQNKTMRSMLGFSTKTDKLHSVTVGGCALDNPIRSILRGTWKNTSDVINAVSFSLDGSFDYEYNLYYLKE